MLKLHGFQSTLKNKILDAWERVRAVLAVLPTGGGKTVVFSSVIHDHNGASAAVVHRKEIIRQISVSLAKLEVKHRIIAPPQLVRNIRRRHLKLFGKSFVDPQASCGVVSVQTVTSSSAGRNSQLQRWLSQVTLAVFDEGHHYTQDGKWGKAVRTFDRARLLFVTATPERADGKGLGAHADGFAEEMVVGPSMQWLIDNGYLTPFRYFCPASDLDMSDAHTGAGGDYTHQFMRKKVVESHLVGDVVQHYQKFTPGRQAIVFATDVETAGEMAAAFRAAGVTAVALSGETDGNERDHELERFEAKQTQVLVNVDLFDEGFDVPAVEVTIMARPTESVAKFLQMIGRALRVLDGKEYAYVIDAVRNWERHGMPNWPRKWTLDARPKNGRAGPSDAVKQKICFGCTQPYPAYLLGCPYQMTPECADPPDPPGRSAPEQVDGDLTELDVSALSALYARIARADLNDEEYEQELIARNVPRIGRPRLLRAHRTAKYRRQVLHNLVGWWLGMQPVGRDDREKNRRFFHRFGVDIGTAFTLGADETDALIGTIKRQFTEDMT